MKRYLLTAGNKYYPLKGTGNWIKMFDSISEAQEQIIDVTSNRYDNEYLIYGQTFNWYDIIDLENWENHE